MNTPPGTPRERAQQMAQEMAQQIVDLLCGSGAAQFGRAGQLEQGAQAQRPGRPWLVAIDGRSGSGKSSLATALSSLVREENPQVLALDTVYPNWDGLADGARAASALVEAWRRGDVAEYRPTQWPGMSEQARVMFTPDRPLIVEGVGAVAACLAEPDADAHADVRVWCEAPEDVRRSRALERDGATFEPHWERWTRQEDEFFRAGLPVVDLTLQRH